VPTSTNFDDIRKWHNHYGYDGALYPSWSLGQTELRYMAEKPSGAVSLNDFSGKIGYLAKDASHIGTANSFVFPGRTKIDLMSSPNAPTYGSEPDTEGFGDPMGNYLFTRLQGRTTWSAVFSSTHFYYNKSRSLNISFDWVHRTNLSAPEFNLVVVEYQRKFGDSISRVLHSVKISGPENDRNIKRYSTSVSFGSDYPYKIISLQNNNGSAGGPANYYTLIRVANMRVTE